MISEGVKVSVETFYQPDYSNPLQSEFMFAYRITLENHNVFPVKLHRRHWHIFDSNGSNREVEGEGVVGVQPTIHHFFRKFYYFDQGSYERPLRQKNQTRAPTSVAIRPPTPKHSNNPGASHMSMKESIWAFWGFVGS